MASTTYLLSLPVNLGSCRGINFRDSPNVALINFTTSSNIVNICFILFLVLFVAKPIDGDIQSFIEGNILPPTGVLLDFHVFTKEPLHLALPWANPGIIANDFC